MLRKLSLAFTAVFVACASFAFDIVLKNGSIYKDVVVMTKTPDGVDIESHRDCDVLVFRHVRYCDMNQDSLKNFPDYDKAKADELLVSMKSKFDAAQTKFAAKQADWIKKNQADEPITYPAIPASWLVLRSTKELKHGTIGWGTTEDAVGPSTTGHFGKIYVYGLKVTEGNEWAGNLYHTNKMMVDGNEICPCYATSKETADILNNRSEIN